MEEDRRRKHTHTGREEEGKGGREGHKCRQEKKEVESERQSGWEMKGETSQHHSTKCRSKQ